MYPTTAPRGAALVAAAAALCLTLGTLLLKVPAAAGPTEEPLGDHLFLARADNPVDALAAGSIAGTLGAPVLLSGSRRLDAATARALEQRGPDLVVLAGGTAALSEDLRREVEALGFRTRRVSGPGRIETAAALAAFAEEVGAGRPVVTGRRVSGTPSIDGTLTTTRGAFTATEGPPFTVASDAVVPRLHAARSADAARLGGLRADQLVRAAHAPSSSAIPVFGSCQHHPLHRAEVSVPADGILLVWADVNAARAARSTGPAARLTVRATVAGAVATPEASVTLTASAGTEDGSVAVSGAHPVRSGTVPVVLEGRECTANADAYIGERSLTTLFVPFGGGGIQGALGG
jgi:hypothetical protein